MSPGWIISTVINFVSNKFCNGSLKYVNLIWNVLLINFLGSFYSYGPGGRAGNAVYFKIRLTQPLVELGHGLSLAKNFFNIENGQIKTILLKSSMNINL